MNDSNSQLSTMGEVIASSHVFHVHHLAHMPDCDTLSSMMHPDIPLVIDVPRRSGKTTRLIDLAGFYRNTYFVHNDPSIQRSQMTMPNGYDIIEFNQLLMHGELILNRPQRSYLDNMIIFDDVYTSRRLLEETLYRLQMLVTRVNIVSAGTFQYDGPRNSCCESLNTENEPTWSQWQ